MSQSSEKDTSIQIETDASKYTRKQPRLPTHDEHKDAVRDAFSELSYDTNLGWGARRALLSYYSQQDRIIKSMDDMQKVHEGRLEDFEAAMAAEERHARRALNLSFASNVILLGVRAAIAGISGSLSLIVALIDAVLDVLSSAMMYYAAWEARRPLNKYKYPVGKHRMEPLGVIVFSCIMATAAFTVIIEGIKQLASKEHGEGGLNQQWLVIGGTILMVVMKGALYLYCKRSPNVSAQAFATDHLNDMIVNSTSLAGALLGAYVQWWLDPMIAILISLWVMYSWGRQGIAEMVRLVGVSATPEVLQKLTYLAATHAPEHVKQVDTVIAYTAGTHFIAEVDIILAPEMPLKEAHDVGESLQIKLEQIPGITRAYVHLDVDAFHKPEH